MKEFHLDVKDRHLLMALDMDARKSDSLIAKEIGLSKQTTNYRIKRLEKNGIIKSYYAIIDHTKIGKKLFRLGLKLENASPNTETEILNYLKRKASWMVSTLGPWDIWMAIYANDKYEFLKFWYSFYEKFGRYISKKWISEMIIFWNLKRSFISQKNFKKRKNFVLGQNPIEVKIDETDKNILHHITSDARQPTIQLAKKVNLSERMVRERLRRLEREKIILGYRPFIDTTVMGFIFFKIFISLRNSQAEDLKKIRATLSHSPDVVYITEALGGYDIELEVLFKNSKQLYSFINDIRRSYPENIKDICYMEYMKEHKVTYFSV